jgi:hypothetical protein
MSNTKTITASALFAISIMASIASASYANSGASYNQTEIISHSGGTNAAGCHNDRKRGGYHCH